MGRNLKKITAVFVLLLLTTSCLIAPVSAAEETAVQSGTVGINYLQSVIQMIKEMYNGEIDDQKIINGALKGMLESVDPYTTFYKKDEFNDFMESSEGNYSGIGITMSKPDKAVIIIKVTPASPAEKAGIRVGDKITEVDGKDISNLDIDQIPGLIKGEAGTKVTLGIIKDGKDTATQIELTREKILVDPITYEIKNDIAYIKIDSFNANAYDSIGKVLQDVDSKKITKVILDLRNNPGGDVEVTTKLAGYFVPKGLVTKLEFKAPFYSDAQYFSLLPELKYKLAVLVNKNSASASEILSGAIQDTKAGVLIGTKTYGKGKVQTFIPILTPEAYEKYSEQVGTDITNAYDLIYKYKINPFENEIIGWSKMTTGYYYTPSGKMIDGVGLEPDIKVEDPKTINDININSVQKLGKSSKPNLKSESIEVYKAEKILKMSGYDIDTPDYILDQKTFDAIKKYQEDSGLFSYGVLDFTTQQALNDTLDKLVMTTDEQYAKAVDYLNK